MTDHRERQRPHMAGVEAAGRPDALDTQEEHNADRNSRLDIRTDVLDTALIDAIKAINGAVKKHRLTRAESIELFAVFGFTFEQVRV